ncbi:ankyrin repeat domain-containing protein [Legionella gresilensis]|uniref:ankyrin repeat domain-containing protein n=1 Tax=Legionella gresilensis TaxID=91823 RepID=UPI0013EFAF25|nr:ankyrin repeat domain-containing protein [Legionella gresilensis]
MRWLEAAFLGDKELNKFNKRIKYIKSVPVKKIIESIEAAQAKRGQNITKKDYALMDILVFFDSLEIFHSPEEYSPLFGRNSCVNTRETELTSGLASSKAIEEQGGLTEIYSEPFIFNEEELKNYLDNLSVLFEEQAQASASQEPIGFLLSNSAHTVALIYTPGQGFTYRDINQEKQISTTRDHTDIVNAIRKGFRNSGPYSAFNTKIILTADDKRRDSLQQKLGLFKQEYSLTKEIAHREAEGINLTYIAAQHGCSSLLTPLKYFEVDFNKADNDGVTPAIIAAQFGDAAFIDQLAFWGADLNQADKNGTTPAYIAAQEGHSNIIAQLGFWRANLNKADAFGTTPAYIATQEGHVNVVKELIACEVNFDEPLLETKTELLQFAKEKGVEIERRMADFLAGYSKEKVEIRPYDIALIMGHQEIANLIKIYVSNQNDESVINDFKAPKELSTIIDKKRGHSDNMFFSHNLKDVSNITEQDKRIKIS